MSARTMMLEIPAYGERFEIELLWDEAPRTAAAVWAALPIEKPGFHGRRSGKEVFLLADPFENPGRENTRLELDHGDVMFVYFPPDWSDDHPDFTRGEEGLFDIAFVYGEDAMLCGPEQPLRANHFGRVRSDQLERLAAACDRIWREGGETLLLRQGRPRSG